MEENIIRNYNDVKIKCMKKVYIPNVILMQEDARNKISLLGNYNYNFESIVEVLGKIYFDDLMKNGGEDKQILLNTLKEYDNFVAEDIEDMGRVQSLVPKLFTAYVMSGINDIRDALGQDKAADILTEGLTPIETYSELSSAIPDEIKSIFAKWQGTSSAKDILSENYKDVSNRHFQDNPVLLKKFSEEQDELFKALKGAKRLNKTQIDFCVQMLSRYAINCSDNPVEKLLEISPEIARKRSEQSDREITEMKVAAFVLCLAFVTVFANKMYYKFVVQPAAMEQKPYYSRFIAASKKPTPENTNPNAPKPTSPLYVYSKDIKNATDIYALTPEVTDAFEEEAKNFDLKAGKKWIYVACVFKNEPLHYHCWEGELINDQEEIYTVSGKTKLEHHRGFIKITVDKATKKIVRVESQRRDSDYSTRGFYKLTTITKWQAK